MHHVQFTDSPEFTITPCGVLIDGKYVGDIMRFQGKYHFFPDEDMNAPFCCSDSSPMGAVLQYIKWLEVEENHV